MLDVTREQPSPDIDPFASPACCPGGACGPIFETPLVELLFNGVRGAVRRRFGGPPSDANPTPLGLDAPNPPGIGVPTPQSRKDANP